MFRWQDYQGGAFNAKRVEPMPSPRTEESILIPAGFFWIALIFFFNNDDLVSRFFSVGMMLLTGGQLLRILWRRRVRRLDDPRPEARERGGGVE